MAREPPRRTRRDHYVSGSIRSREDVGRALDRICDYYSKSSFKSRAVPLRRGQKLAVMDFVQAVQEVDLIAGPFAAPAEHGLDSGQLAPPASASLSKYEVEW